MHCVHRVPRAAMLITLVVSSSAWAQPAAKPIGSVEARWPDVYCDLLQITRPAPEELQLRYRYRNAGKTALTFPTLNDFVPHTRVLDPEGRTLYGPIRDSDGKTVGSSTTTSYGAGLSIAPGASQAHWVKLQAPPEAATNLVVIVQGCAPFEGMSPDGSAAPVEPLAAPRQALASQDMQVAGMVVEVLDVRRTAGGMVTVHFRYRNTGNEPYAFPTLVNQAADAYLVDAGNRKKYPVVRDKDDRPLASTTQDLLGGAGAHVDPGGTLTMWAKFPAPPDTTAKVSMYIPEAPPFDGLEIAGAGSGGGAAGTAVSGTAVGLDAALRDLRAAVTEGEIRIALEADVLFDFDEAVVKPDAEPSLRKVATVIAAHPGAAVTIVGHTDSQGAAAYNQTLSERRAAAVADWLAREAGVPSTRLKTSGAGSTKPVAHNTRPDGSDDPEGRAKNRRVEIVVSR